MSKTNEELLGNLMKSTTMPVSLTLLAMQAARADEREKVDQKWRDRITHEIFFLSDKPDSKDRWAINRLNKLLSDTPEGGKTEK